MGKTSWKITLVLMAVALVSAFKYNTMLNMQESFTKQWDNVEAQCMRRANLIPKLIRTAKGSAIGEEEIFDRVTKAKASASGVTIDAQNLSADNMRKFQTAQNNLNSALIELLDLTMRYPDLQENQTFLDMAAKLEGEGNRIEVQKRRFDEQAKLYNAYIQKFPANLVAKMIGYEEQATVLAVDRAEMVPEVQL